MKTFLLSPRLAAVVLSACGVMVWQDAQAHDAVSSLFLSGENGTLTVRDSGGNPVEIPVQLQGNKGFLRVRALGPQ